MTMSQDSVRAAMRERLAVLENDIRHLAEDYAGLRQSVEQLDHKLDRLITAVELLKNKPAVDEGIKIGAKTAATLTAVVSGGMMAAAEVARHWMGSK
jgi:predicted nuclease with TOPRIM domain